MAANRRLKEQMRKRLMAGLRGVAIELTNAAKLRATRHVYTGELRNSITHTEVSKYVLFGIPANAKNISLEFGFKPHWVPLRYLGAWMQRNRVGVRRAAVYSVRTRRRSSRLVVSATGLYVGGPGSRLDYGIGGASGERVFGRKRIIARWNTRGARSKYIASGKVGFSIIRHTVGTHLRAVALPAFIRGYRYER